MSRIVRSFIALLSAWERRTDAEFAGMDEIEQQAITEFINGSTY